MNLKEGLEGKKRILCMTFNQNGTGPQTKPVPSKPVAVIDRQDPFPGIARVLEQVGDRCCST